MRRMDAKPIFDNLVAVVANLVRSIAIVFCVCGNSGCNASHVGLRATVGTIPIELSVNDVSFHVPGSAYFGCYRSTSEKGLDHVGCNNEERLLSQGSR